MTTSPSGDRLRVGAVPGVTLTKWRRIWEERFPRVTLDVLEVDEADQRRVLADDAVDMCFVRLPVDQEGLHVIPLYDEVMVVWASKEHPVSVLDEVTLADLAGEAVVDAVTAEAVDVAAHSGATMLLVPMSIARSHSRRDMAYRPVTDAAPSTVALAWRTDSDNVWVDEFIGVVRGRTVNSSRTARERGDEPVAAKPAPARKAAGSKGSRPAPRRRLRRR
ncbi:hypothetical protein BE11_06575 [Sorangium cellulosum]|nr:hypothetical protein BE11_06575 [Sorangium cellulosum]